MKIISFDIGIKNMAYCILNENGGILDWEVLNLVAVAAAEPSGGIKQGSASLVCSACKRKAKMALPDGRLFCKIHSDAGVGSGGGLVAPNTLKLSQMKKPELVAKLVELGVREIPQNKAGLIEKLKERILTPTKTAPASTAAAKDVSLIDIGRKIREKLDFMQDKLRGLTHVIIENQISPIATRMKTIQGMLAQYFIICFPAAEIQFISSHNKLKGVDGPAGAGAAGPTPTYSTNKKMSVMKIEEILADNWRDFFHSHKKKDDLADCLLQGLWFVRKINS